jgi:hypothetical protein
MVCSKCEEEKELMPRRKVCRTCFNKEKVIQRQNRIPNEREEECRKCFQIKTIPKGKTWCKECKNDYEKLRKSKFTETKKDEEKQKSQEYYKKIKENVTEIVIDDTETKICSVCNEDKTLDKYFVAKCKGTIRAACKECLSKDRKEYYQVNKKQINKQTSDYKVARCKVDPEFKILKTLRSRLYHALKNQKADKKYRTKQLTGCELSFLKGYLEAKFTEGMSWENRGEWHIDHIKPCCSFDLKEEEEQKKCFHYTNLQPLWAAENLSKGGKCD